MQTTEDKEVVEKLKDNREELVDSIAENTGMTEAEDRAMINETLEQTYLDERFSEASFEETDELAPSMTEALLSSPKPSHGVAVVDSMQEDDGILQILFRVKGTDTTFTRTYETPGTEEENSNRGHFGYSSPDKDLEAFEKLVRVTDSDIDQPSTLIGKSVPIKPEYKGNYEIDYPPESHSIPNHLYHRLSRVLYNYKLVSYNPNRGKYDISHAPNRRSWGISLATIGLSFLNASAFGLSMFIIGTCFVVCCILLHTLYIVES